MNGDRFLTDRQVALLLLNLSATTNEPIDASDARAVADAQALIDACVRHVVGGTCVDAAAAGLLGVRWDRDANDLVFTTDPAALARVRAAFAEHGVEVPS